MGELVKVLEVAIEEQDKMKVMVVLEDILDYAIAEVDGKLVERTLEVIYIMKEEN